MNTGNGHNVFSDIPGFDATKGERIVKALQRLWAKIERLEQIRVTERKSRSKEVQTSSNDEDLSITDVQYKLLVLQLQYARSIIRKKLGKMISTNTEVVVSNQNSSERNGSYENDVDVHNFRQSVLQAVCQATQTGNSLIGGDDHQMDASPGRSEDRVDAQVSTDSSVFLDEDDVAQSGATSHKTLFSCSKPHYHLKLDDVPFILGASSTASHSVVANVQNIIAMMKTHNKALCGSRHHTQRAPVTKLHASRGDCQDTSKMMNELNQDLHELRQKQKILIKRFDSAQENSQASLISKASDNKDNMNKNSGRKLISNEGHKRLRSNSESTKVQAEVKNVIKLRERDIAKYNAQQQRQIVPTTRNQSSNLPTMARRKLLRSLQNFKSHLSEEDISWE